MNDRERAIIAQVAAKAAAELCHGMGRDGMTDYLACSEMVFSDILDKIGDEPADVPAAAAAPVMPPALSPVTQAQAAVPGAEVTSAAVPATPPPPAAAAKPPGGARKKKMLDANGFVTDDKQAAWNVAFLCAGQKTADGKVVVFDNQRKKASGEWKPNAADFNITEAGAAMYGLGNKRIGLWLSDAPTHIQAADGSILPFNVEDMHARCGA